MRAAFALTFVLLSTVSKADSTEIRVQTFDNKIVKKLNSPIGGVVVLSNSDKSETSELTAHCTQLDSSKHECAELTFQRVSAPGVSGFAHEIVEQVSVKVINGDAAKSVNGDLISSQLNLDVTDFIVDSSDNIGEVVLYNRRMIFGSESDFNTRMAGVIFAPVTLVAATIGSAFSMVALPFKVASDRRQTRKEVEQLVTLINFTTNPNNQGKIQNQDFYNNYSLISRFFTSIRTDVNE